MNSYIMINHHSSKLLYEKNEYYKRLLIEPTCVFAKDFPFSQRTVAHEKDGVVAAKN